VNYIINFFAKLYDSIEKYWEGDKNQKILGTGIVFSFIISLILIQLNRWGILPSYISPYISTNHFFAVEVAFIVLLGFEVLSLVFILPSSVAKSLHKQFEIISLIMLRNAFKEFSHFGEPIDWNHSYDTILHIFANASTALIIFFGIYLIRNIRTHYIITESEKEQNRFISIKKMTSILLLLSFVFLAIQDSYFFLTHQETYKFFSTFYTVLIFTDVLMVLVSLRYSYNYMILFRNSGFTLATVLLRIALSAPVYANSIIVIFAIVFVFLLTLVYQNMQKKKIKLRSESK